MVLPRGFISEAVGSPAIGLLFFFCSARSSLTGEAFPVHWLLDHKPESGARPLLKV